MEERIKVTVVTLTQQKEQCTFPFALGVALTYGKSFPRWTEHTTIDIPASSYSEERKKEEVQKLVEKMSDWRLNDIQQFFTSRHKILSRQWKEDERTQIVLFFRDVFWTLRIESLMTEILGEEQKDWSFRRSRN